MKTKTIPEIETELRETHSRKELAYEEYLANADDTACRNQLWQRYNAYQAIWNSLTVIRNNLLRKEGKLNVNRSKD